MTIASVGKDGRLRRGKSLGLRFMNGFVNHFVAALLRSPVHGLLSGHFLLVSVAGWRTGKRYTTPVNYVADGAGLTIVSSLDRAWWRNLTHDHQRHISVLLKGKRRVGMAQVLWLTPEETREAYADYMKRLRGRRPPEARLAQAAANKVIIRVELEPER